MDISGKIDYKDIQLKATLFKDDRDKSWTAWIGKCVAYGDTKKEALRNLSNVVWVVCGQTFDSKQGFVDEARRYMRKK